MKTFKHLKFKPHPANYPGCDDGTQARMDFPNGYGVSVITGSMFYSTPDTPYELAILKNGRLCYDTPITDDVLGYLTKKEVTEVMKQVQNL